MTLALKRVKVYLKLVAILAVSATVLLVILMNRRSTADVWLFRLYRDVNVLWLMLVTAVSSIVAWWGFRSVFKVVRELKEVRQLKKQEIELEKQRRLARELAEREKRIDEKVRRSITEDS